MIWFLSCIGHVPTPNAHLDIWDHVESYVICMLLACRLKITFTLSLKLMNSFLVSTTPSFLSLDCHFFSGQSWHMPLPLLSCCISSLGQKGLLHNHTNASYPGLLRVTLASRGNSASKNLQQETQWPKCYLYEAPYIAAPIRETGDTTARTPLYVRLSTGTPIRASFFWFTSNAFLKRPILLKNWLLCPFFYKEATSKSSTKKGLLYAIEELGQEHFKCLSLYTLL
jgi:hypothetical protein